MHKILILLLPNPVLPNVKSLKVMFKRKVNSLWKYGAKIIYCIKSNFFSGLEDLHPTQQTTFFIWYKLFTLNKKVMFATIQTWLRASVVGKNFQSLPIN